jgi:hypothetical protein
MDWQARLYGREVMLFVRREFDTQQGTENSLKLLSEMDNRATVLTRWRYRRFFDKSQALPDYVKEELANRFINSLGVITVDGPNDYVAPETFAQMRKTLGEKTDKVRLYANRSLAHRSAEYEVPKIMVPTDTDEAIFAVQAVFDKLYLLLTGISMPDPAPAIQYDWEDAFRHAWMPPEVAERINEAEMAEREAKSSEVLESIKNRGKNNPQSFGGFD